MKLLNTFPARFYILTYYAMLLGLYKHSRNLLDLYQGKKGHVHGANGELTDSGP